MTSSYVLTIYTRLFLLFIMLPIGIMFANSGVDFGTLSPSRLIDCVTNSIQVAIIVVPFSILLGLSGAMVLCKANTKYTSGLWWVLIAPIMLPGISVGIATLVFWKNVGANAGFFAIIAAQTTFIASYCMLVLFANLKKIPPELEQSAISLGATPTQVFFYITLPLLVPAIASSAVISFLASVENYGTTIFVKGGYCTFATEVGAMTRNPNGYPSVINTLGISVFCVTGLFAAGYLFLIRREND